MAKLAGVPDSLLKNAQHKLAQLEEGRAEISVSQDSFLSSESPSENKSSEAEEQISFFTTGPNPIIERIRNLNLMEITPSKAIGILEELKEAIND